MLFPTQLLRPILLAAVLSTTLTPGLPSAALAAGSERTVTLAFAGDVMLADEVNLVVSREGTGTPLAAVPELGEADLALVNLESVSATAGARNDATRRALPYYFRSRPEVLGVIHAAGVDVVTTANTHTGDYGPHALLEQLDHLDAAGIVAAGSGPSVSHACAPAYMRSNDLVIALFSFQTMRPSYEATHDKAGACYVPLERDAVLERYTPAIAEARTRANLVLVAPHWGEDFVTEPSDEMRDIGRRLIDAGADAVLGSNAHVTQGVEIHDGRPIVHDAGNLLLSFDEPRPAALFQLGLSADGVTEIRFTPLVAERGWTRRASRSEADQIVRTFAERSARLGTRVVDGRIMLDPDPRPAPTAAPPIMPRQAGHAPRPLAQPPAACVVDAVPAAASLAPVRIEQLELIGLEAEGSDGLLPGFMKVTTYWRVHEPPAGELMLAARGSEQGGAPNWSAMQQPCDWAWPTSRWRPGLIYRDEMWLRPEPHLLHPVGAAAAAAGIGSPLSITIGVTDGGTFEAWSGPLARVSYGAPPGLQMGALATAAGLILVVVVAVRRRRRSQRLADSA